MGMSNSTGILPGLADIAVYLAIAIVTLIGVFKCLIPLCTPAERVRPYVRSSGLAGIPFCRQQASWQLASFPAERGTA